MTPRHALAALAIASLALAPAARAGPSTPCPPAAAVRAAAARESFVAAGLSLTGPPPDTSAFVLFGWVSPPAGATTEGRIAEMADMGLNLALPAWLDEGCADDNHARLDWAAAHGMRCLIWDARLVGAYRWAATFEDTLNQVTADYRDHPGLWGYYLGDEPPRDAWPLLTRLRAALRGRDPTHPAWNTLVGRAGFSTRDEYAAHLGDYATEFLPAVLSSDFYGFHATDDPRFVENLTTLRDVAAAQGLPFWNIVQLIPHLDYRPLTRGELRWEVTQSLAHGARGIGYFTYWTPDPDPQYNWQSAIIAHDGTPTAWYGFLMDFDRGVRLAGETLARARRLRTWYSDPVPPAGEAMPADSWFWPPGGHVVVGEYEGAGGKRLALVGNLDSLAARRVVLWTRDASDARLVAGGSSPTPEVIPGLAAVTVTLQLAAGDFALVELGPPIARPAVRAAPNPAAGTVRFAVLDRLGDSFFEILDLGGRVIWSDRTPGNAREVVWSGVRGDGRRAPPGIYFARLVGGRFDFGAPREPDAVTRFVWLGASP